MDRRGGELGAVTCPTAKEAAAVPSEEVPHHDSEAGAAAETSAPPGGEDPSTTHTPDTPAQAEAGGDTDSVRERKREERNRALRYTAGGAAFLGALVALYHATMQRGGSLAGLLAPAAIMVLYLLWVLYSTRANRHAARLAAAAAATASAEASMTPSPPSIATIEDTVPEIRPLKRSSSKLALNGGSDSRQHLSTMPSRMRGSSAALHRSTESLYRASSHRALNSLSPSTSSQQQQQPAGVHHRSTLNLSAAAAGQRGGRGQQQQQPPRLHGGRMMRSTQQLNTSRQLAAAAANLPTYEEATNRSHWLLTHNHSRERLLRN